MSYDGKRMLCVFAHPDDECYGPGGTIAHYALLGVEISILMFTCGEAGSIGVSRELERDELCRRRSKEFAASCSALGVAGYRIVGAPDKAVNAMAERAAIDEIHREMDSLGPHVVLTFHYRGVSSHPDHIAVTSYLEKAFDEAAVAGAPGPLKLYEWGIPEEKSRLYDRPNLAATPDHEVHARITPSREAMERKISAIERHCTQYDFYLSLQEKFDYRTNSSPECFTLRRTRLPRTDDAETDLFVGMD